MPAILVLPSDLASCVEFQDLDWDDEEEDNDDKGDIGDIEMPLIDMNEALNDHIMSEDLPNTETNPLGAAVQEASVHEASV